MKYTWLVLFVAMILVGGCGEDGADREDSNAFMAMAESSLDEGNWDDAIEYLEKATELDPGLAPAYQKLGLIHEAVLSDTETAVNYYSLAIKYEKNPARKSKLSRWLKNHEMRTSDLERLQARKKDVVQAHQLPSNAVAENQPKPVVSPVQYYLLKDTVELQENTIDDLNAEKIGQKDAIAQLKSKLEENEKTKIELQSQIEDLSRANAAQTPETELQIKYKEAVRKNSLLYKRFKTAQNERDKAIAENNRLKGQQQTPSANNQNSGHTLYTTKQYDTLRNIADKFYGDREKYDIIYNANPDKLTSVNIVPVGVQLKIPKIK